MEDTWGTTDTTWGGGGGGDTAFEDGDANNNERKNKSSACRRCGEEGHFVKECTQEEKTRTVIGEDGTEREIYIPKEIDQEELFNQGISCGINFEKFDRIQVNVSGENIPHPIRTFEDAGLRQLLMDNIKRCGYDKPTPIQKHGIPIVLANRDVMGCAQTGSGKTAAFLLPILHRILEDGCSPKMGENSQTPQAVIVAPTRELAIQIKDEARKFAQGSVIKAVVVYGGTSTGFQINQVRKGCNVLIATPGRLKDLIEKGVISFEEVKFLVLDEADRMLDQGFKGDIETIASAANMPGAGERQTLMFSATFPDEVQELAKDFLNNYLFLAVGIIGGANSDVDQTFYEVEKFGKRDKLKELIQEVQKTDRTLVFVETKKTADFIAAFLCTEGFPATSIHGDRFQRQREEALADFKTGRRPILVATAVAARGLDIKGVSYVINYDLPKGIDDYVHRIGRTGRVGNIGKAFSFFDSGSQDPNLAPGLIKILKDCNQHVPEFILNCSQGISGDGGAEEFGGTDIRHGTGQTSGPTDEEENWG